MAEVCRCPIKPGMTEEELRQIVRDRKMCTDVPGKRWMCPELDRLLVKAHKESYWRKSKKKKLIREGHTEEAAEQLSKKKKGMPRGYVATSVVDLNVLDI